MPEPRLLALATAVPEFALRQPEVRQRARALFAGTGEIDRLLPVFENAGIDTRYSCVPIDWYDAPHGWKDRNRLYIENATRLLAEVTRACLAASGLAARELDAIVVVSTTGIATPSLDAVLIERLGLRR